MGVTPKAYTKETIKTLDAAGLRRAVPEILKAFNENRDDLSVWELYHAAALRQEALKPCIGISHAQWRESLYDYGTHVPPETVETHDAAPAVPATAIIPVPDTIAPKPAPAPAPSMP